MKPHERRTARAYPYFKVATWDAVSLVWRDGRVAHPSLAAALRSIRPGTVGRFRVSEVGENGERHDMPPFEVK